MARNLTWAKWSDNLFVYGRRVPENLGAGNVIVIPTGGREGGYRLGERRAVEGYPSFRIIVRMGPQGDNFDLAELRATEIHDLLSASWTGVLPGQVGSR